MLVGPIRAAHDRKNAVKKNKIFNGIDKAAQMLL